MKKIFFSGCISVLLLSIVACNETVKSDTHMHEDGTTHEAHDTIMPVQEQFNVGDTTHSDSTGTKHTHKEGEEHLH